MFSLSRLRYNCTGWTEREFTEPASRRTGSTIRQQQQQQLHPAHVQQLPVRGDQDWRDIRRRFRRTGTESCAHAEFNNFHRRDRFREQNIVEVPVFYRVNHQIRTVIKRTFFTSLQLMNNTFRQVLNEETTFAWQKYEWVGVFRIKVRSLVQKL